MRLVTAEEIAKKLGVKPSWVHERTRNRCPEADRIPCIKLGKYVRFSELEIDASIQRGCKPARAK